MNNSGFKTHISSLCRVNDVGIASGSAHLVEPLTLYGLYKYKHNNIKIAN